MSIYGPYNSPLVFVSRPWSCLFWSIWAMMIIPPAVFTVIDLIVPGLFETAFSTETVDAYALRWVFISIGMSAALFGMMVWSEYVGAGPFAGPVQLSASWTVVSLVGGPSILFAVLFFMDLILGGEGTNWAIREDISVELMDPDNYGILFAVLIIGIYPLAEEIAYRGIGLGYLLARGMEPAFAIGLTSFVWTLSHTQATPFGLAPIFVAGVFFGWLRVRSGSMAAPILAHMAANGVQFIV